MLESNKSNMTNGFILVKHVSTEAANPSDCHFFFCLMEKQQQIFQCASLSHLWVISVRSHLHWKTGTKCLCALTGRCWRSCRVVHLSAAGILQFVFGVAARGSTVQWQRDIWQHSSQDSCLHHALSKHLTAETASFHAISYQYLITFHCLQLLTDKWKTWMITLLHHVTNDPS